MMYKDRTLRKIKARWFWYGFSFGSGIVIIAWIFKNLFKYSIPVIWRI